MRCGTLCTSIISADPLGSCISSLYKHLAWYTIALGLIGAAIFIKLWGMPSSRGPLPPGPPDNWNKPLPRAAHKYHELSKPYGPVFSLKQGRKLLVVVSGYKAALDIMQKQGSDVADRPRHIAANELLAGGMRAVLIPWGDYIKRLRRALHARLQPSVTKEYQPLQMKNSKNYILDILRDPEHHLDHSRRYAASLIMTVTYGKTTPTSYTDPEVLAVIKLLKHFVKALQVGAYLVDTFPILKYIPIGDVVKLKEQHQEELILFRSQVNRVKHKLAANTAEPCFVTYLLENQEKHGLTDDQLAYVAGSMFAAGSDTTASGIGIIVMAAACHPEEQAKVQAQLDIVVGRDRLPTFGDQPYLTRATAFFMEATRWRPISPSGFAHRATKDVIWNGYVIPSGTTVIGNHLSIMHDPEVFPDPESFKPNRWLNEKGQIRDDLKHFGFGFGRRVCPGSPLAERSLFINTAMMCWAFNIKQDPSAPIDTNRFSDGAIVHPLPYKVKFEQRIPNVSTIIKADMN